MMLKEGNIVLRSYLKTDAPDLVSIANNKNIWLNLRDGFPHPYNIKDADQFIKRVNSENDQHVFGIFDKGVLKGSVGLFVQQDVYRFSAELGYYIGEAHWGQGLATKAIRAIIKYGFKELELNRIYAGVFENNKTSFRVLEKNGFVLEGIKKQGVYKNNQILDEYFYALIRKQE